MCRCWFVVASPSLPRPAGGSDILYKMHQDGELEEMLKKVKK